MWCAFGTQILPRKFYHRVSYDAVEHLRREAGHSLNIVNPSSDDKPLLLGKHCSFLRKARGQQCGLLNSRAIGDRHLRLMCVVFVADFCWELALKSAYRRFEKPGQYLVRSELVAYTLRVFIFAVCNGGPYHKSICRSLVLFTLQALFMLLWRPDNKYKSQITIAGLNFEDSMSNEQVCAFAMKQSANVPVWLYKYC